LLLFHIIIICRYPWRRESTARMGLWDGAVSRLIAYINELVHWQAATEADWTPGEMSTHL